MPREKRTYVIGHKTRTDAELEHFNETFYTKPRLDHNFITGVAKDKRNVSGGTAIKVFSDPSMKHHYMMHPDERDKRFYDKIKPRRAPKRRTVEDWPRTMRLGYGKAVNNSLAGGLTRMIPKKKAIEEYGSDLPFLIHQRMYNNKKGKQWGTTRFKHHPDEQEDYINTRVRDKFGHSKWAKAKHYIPEQYKKHGLYKSWRLGEEVYEAHKETVEFKKKYGKDYKEALIEHRINTQKTNAARSIDNLMKVDPKDLQSEHGKTYLDHLILTKMHRYLQANGLPGGIREAQAVHMYLKGKEQGQPVANDIQFMVDARFRGMGHDTNVSKFGSTITKTGQYLTQTPTSGDSLVKSHPHVVYKNVFEPGFRKRFQQVGLSSQNTALALVNPGSYKSRGKRRVEKALKTVEKSFQQSIFAYKKAVDRADIVEKISTMSPHQINAWLRKPTL